MTGTGGEPWKPRLQRLADARQLAPFEKLVLELLVGCHVSPSVQRTFMANKSGASMDEMTAMSPVTVPPPHNPLSAEFALTRSDIGDTTTMMLCYYKGRVI